MTLHQDVLASADDLYRGNRLRHDVVAEIGEALAEGTAVHPWLLVEIVPGGFGAIRRTWYDDHQLAVDDADRAANDGELVPVAAILESAIRATDRP